ncbi:sorting nexin-21 [Rhinatrema bivittatum]|uniref:sorting nexin-21 n=1 Tax=Rhinatrema bivittatum TaxID=194408 RepID=UPI001126BDE6|nr:sorting nexin-21 [Rhinatrema bivittatum]XP_029468598.1 sorting nexin-21 [Rhinatrema bivittatum]XP_029468599.1 sorting nexin-21 [Rhinatrema bivittatum]XP_029468600.1 sorting nexin-21 [Rhinatrema bivittatum]
MASKILHRIRHTIIKKDTGEREAGGPDADVVEEFPESSELVDDTDGLSTRLSGTLSFTSDGDEEDAAYESLEESCDLEGCKELSRNPEESSPEEAEPSPQEPQQNRPLLTRQIQEFWRKSQTRAVPERLIFEVTSANVVRDGSSKYVLYTIYLIKSGQFDKTPATISRRYSDFEKLNRHLRRRFGCDMHGISFPRKKLRRNFAAETIAKRSRAFEQFLSHMYSFPEIRRCREFLEFFYLRDVQGARQLTCTGLYQDAVALWTNAWLLQNKLHPGSSGKHALLTLAGLAVCHQELDSLEEAQKYCEQALRLLEAQAAHPFLIPFLQAHIHLSWKVGKDKRLSEARLQSLQEAGVSIQQLPTLKECLIKEILT